MHHVEYVGVRGCLECACTEYECGDGAQDRHAGRLPVGAHRGDYGIGNPIVFAADTAENGVGVGG